MKLINYISNLTSIDSKYIILIIKTFIFFLLLNIIKKIGIRIIKKISKKLEKLGEIKWKI